MHRPNVWIYPCPVQWTKLSESLEEMGYHRNEYDWCVINKMVNNKQCTILCQVYDLRISNFDPGVLSTVISVIDILYGNIARMTITQGKIHKCLRMTIAY